MAIEIVPFSTRLIGSDEDCIVLKHHKRVDGSIGDIEMAFPFHEDTPNFTLNLREAMELRNAIDRLYEIKFIEGRN